MFGPLRRGAEAIRDWSQDRLGFPWGQLKGIITWSSFKIWRNRETFSIKSMLGTIVKDMRLYPVNRVECSVTGRINPIILRIDKIGHVGGGLSLSPSHAIEANVKCRAEQGKPNGKSLDPT